MSLRLRLILSYAALILLLGLAAWWGVQRLTSDLTQALGETAASVGRSVVTVLRSSAVRHDDDATPALTEHVVGATDGADARIPRDMRIERRVVTGEDGTPQTSMRVLVDGRELTPAQVVERGLPLADTIDVKVRNLRGEPTMLMLSGAGLDSEIPLSHAPVDAALARFSRQLGLGLLLLFGAGLLLSIWIAQRIARPLRALAASAQTLGRGALGTQAREEGAPEVRQTIAAFNRMSAQLQQLDAETASLRADRELAELGEIGRGLAHSLRNPLHALGLSLEALAAQAGDPARGLELARSGREQLERVDRALRGFLALSAGAGVAAQAVSLREVIDDVVLEAAQRAQGRVAFVREGSDVSLLAVPAEVRVMLHALVVNALEASPDGGSVTVALHRDGDGVRIEVLDDGAGVDAAILARLFQPHVSSKSHGAGMGLFLAQRLATLRYGGTVVLRARELRGTVAVLVLRARGDGHV